MKKKIKIIGVTLICLLICNVGFTLFRTFSARQVTTEELLQILARAEYTSVWRGSFYCGEKSNFHYFCVCTLGITDRSYKVPTNDIGLKWSHPLRLTSFRWTPVQEVITNTLPNQGVYGEP